MVYLSVVIPCHNEEESLTNLCERLNTVLSDNLGTDWEVILVDDASTDNTPKIMCDLSKNNPQFKVIYLNKRGGQTGAFNAAFKIAKGRFIIRMDGDLQDSPEDIPKFLEKLKGGSELVMGLRECRKHSRILRIASGIYDLVVLALFNSPLHSNSGSFVAFRADLVRNIKLKNNDHRYLPLIAMRRGAKNVSEIFVTHNERKGGKSKYPKFRKVILGVPEVIMFLVRYMLGEYDSKTEDTVGM